MASGLLCEDEEDICQFSDNQVYAEDVAGAQAYNHEATPVADQCWIHMDVTTTVPVNNFDMCGDYQASSFPEDFAFLDDVALNDILFGELNAEPNSSKPLSCWHDNNPNDCDMLTELCNALGPDHTTSGPNELVAGGNLQNVYSCWINTDGCNYNRMYYKSQHRQKTKGPIVELNVLYLAGDLHCFYDVCARVESSGRQQLYPQFCSLRLYNDEGPIESNICPMQVTGDRRYSCNVPGFYLVKEKRHWPTFEVLCQKLLKYRAIEAGLEQSELSEDEVDMLKNTARIHAEEADDKPLCLMVCICIKQNNGNYMRVSGPYFSS